MISPVPFRQGDRSSSLLHKQRSPRASKSWLVRGVLGGVLPALVVPTVIVAGGLCWYDRPRGWADHELVEQVKPSPVHERGVFAKRQLSPGLIIGVYPGRARGPKAMAEKAALAPACKGFVFWNSNGFYLDPTGVNGWPCSQPRPGLPWIDIDPLLAFVNEPPPGKLTNVSVSDGQDACELAFVVTDSVDSGEELFIDYGMSYDRQSYG